MNRALIAAALLAATPAFASPMQLLHQGRVLSPAGDGISGTHDLTVRILDGADTAQFTEVFSAIPLQDGYFALDLGASTPLDSSVFLDHGAMFLEIQVDGVSLSTSPMGGYPLMLAKQSLHALESTAQQAVSDVSDVSSDVSGLANDVAGLTQDLDSVSADVGEVASDLSGLSSDVESLGTDLATVGADVDALSSDLSGVSGDVSDLSTDVDALSTQLQILTALLQGIATNVSQIEAAQSPPVYSEDCSDWNANGWDSIQTCRQDGRWHQYATTTGAWDSEAGFVDWHNASKAGADTKLRFGLEWYRVSVRSDANPAGGGGVWVFLAEGTHHFSMVVRPNGQIDNVHATSNDSTFHNNFWDGGSLGNWHYFTHNYGARRDSGGMPNLEQYGGIAFWARY